MTPVRPVPPDVDPTPDELADALAGRYVRDEHATLLDFEEIELARDGSYTARVEATLLHAGVRTFGARCMLPEEGKWNAYVVTNAVRLRIRPTTSKARVYVVTMGEGRVEIARRGMSTTLVTEHAASGVVRVAGVVDPDADADAATG